MIDPALKEWATPRQSEVIDALIAHGSIQNAAEALGMTASRLRGHMSEVKRRAARRGYSPDHDMVKKTAPGFHVNKLTTEYAVDEDGNRRVARQWVKENEDQRHRIENLLDAMQGVLEPIRGLGAKDRSPRGTDADLLTLYIMGDPHLGMYAWAEESGRDFDLDIASRELVSAAEMLVDQARPTERAVVLNCGDFFHSDTKANRTNQSGHALDVDTRWAKVLRTGIQTEKAIIDAAQAKHRQVDAFNVAGNHDEHTAIMLSLWMAEHYSHNPRVKVCTSADPFLFYHFGENAFMFNHGERKKPADMPGIMLSDFREKNPEALAARHWYVHLGHIHHDVSREYNGVIVESHRTMAPRDAWHHAAGYRSGQSMKADTHHRDYGRFARNEVNPAMIARAKYDSASHG